MMNDEKAEQMARMDSQRDPSTSRTASAVAPTSAAGAGERVDALVQREADHHDLIAHLWAVTDPETVSPEIMARVHACLGVNDPEGHCGNAICQQLADTERERDAQFSLVADLASALKGIELHFQRNHNSGNWLGDDDHEAWRLAREALKRVKGL